MLSTIYQGQKNIKTNPTKCKCLNLILYTLARNSNGNSTNNILFFHFSLDEMWLYHLDKFHWGKIWHSKQNKHKLCAEKRYSSSLNVTQHEMHSTVYLVKRIRLFSENRPVFLPWFLHIGKKVHIQINQISNHWHGSNCI